MSIRVLSVQGNQVRLGIEAPREVEVHREEIYNKVDFKPHAVPAKRATTSPAVMNIPYGTDMRGDIDSFEHIGELQDPPQPTSNDNNPVAKNQKFRKTMRLSS